MVVASGKHYIKIIMSTSDKIFFGSMGLSIGSVIASLFMIWLEATVWQFPFTTWATVYISVALGMIGMVLGIHLKLTRK
jgi:uncharacterized protein YacL